jgi:hypothetical protein
VFWRVAAVEDAAGMPVLAAAESGLQRRRAVALRKGRDHRLVLG